MDGPIDVFIASCAGDNCQNYQNLDSINLCLETKEWQDEIKDSDDDNKKSDSTKNGVSSSHVDFDVALLNETIVIKLKTKLFSDLGGYKDKSIWVIIWIVWTNNKLYK